MSEEQEDECMSLEAIYNEDFTRESASQVRIRILPSAGEGGGGGKAWVSCTLCCAYRAGYPAVAAALSLLATGLTEAQVAELEGVVGAAALELLGTPVVYAVVEVIREWLTAHNEKPSDGSAFDEMMRTKRAAEAAAAGGGGGGGGALTRELDPSIKKKAAAYVEEDEGVRRRRDGTPVTPESFLKWRAGFEAEMQRAKEDAQERRRCVPGAPTPPPTLAASPFNAHFYHNHAHHLRAQTRGGRESSCCACSAWQANGAAAV